MDSGAGSFDAAPPISGLGNYKGVMLCNRPGDNSSFTGAASGEASEPFRSMISATYGDQLGLTPCRDFVPTVKKRGPSAALRRHVRWLKELENQMREDRTQEAVENEEEQIRRAKLKETFDGHREAVREMMKARDDENRKAEEERKATKAAEREAALSLSVPPPPGSTLPPSAAAESAASKPKKKAAKPLWAMSEKEKDNFEEEEADDLINFAENLDYEKYVGDLEFREGLQAVKDRAGKLKKEQIAFKEELLANFNASMEEAGDEDDDDDASTALESSQWQDGVDGQSILGSEYSCASSKRSRREREMRNNGAPDWDSSTNAGDDRPKVDENLRELAEVVLENRPDLKQIHSKGSVQRMIEKAKEKTQQEANNDLVDLMRAEGGCPVPVITSSSDTQSRLHKPVDPSQLPYLYRSPAV
eukprot:TRINITY_DN35786_c0_g1_i1.p1 TRINITY_DN35786_c0_g1~~TRINITY_DN35786_c0_g1_i1.p1  ORF type:complete len:419 (+),score=123.64 TRINITY_DN35786_c0_g1_i1:43-1299(+)